MEYPKERFLDPSFSIIFINDMKLSVKGSIIRLFADDTRMLKHIASTDDMLVLQSDLSSVIKWAKRNKRFSVRHTKSPMEISFIQSTR